MQPHHAAIAVDERLHPAEALVRSRQRERRGLAAPNAAIEHGPTFQEDAQARVRRCDVLAHAHIARTQLTGHDGLAFGHEQVLRRQAREQSAVQVLNRVDAVEARGLGVICMVPLDRGFGFGIGVGDGQPLPDGESLVAGEVFAQRLLDLERPSVLALDAVRVVRVHATQQRAQFQRHRLAGQLSCGT